MVKMFFEIVYFFASKIVKSNLKRTPKPPLEYMKLSLSQTLRS